MQLQKGIDTREWVSCVATVPYPQQRGKRGGTGGRQAGGEGEEAPPCAKCFPKSPISSSQPPTLTITRVPAKPCRSLLTPMLTPQA